MKRSLNVLLKLFKQSAVYIWALQYADKVACEEVVRCIVCMGSEYFRVYIALVLDSDYSKYCEIVKIFR